MCGYSLVSYVVLFLFQAFLEGDCLPRFWLWNGGLLERQPQFLRPLTHPVHFFLKDLDRACPAGLFMVV